MATDIAEQAIEQVADNLEEAAVVVRHINAHSMGYFFGGLGVGLAVGFIVGYRWNRSKIRAEAFKESEEQVEQIRELYRDAKESVKIASSKPELDTVVEERGYSVEIKHPDRIVPDDIPEEVMKRPLVPPGPVMEPPPAVTIKLDTGKSKDLHWDFAEELASRSEDHPYIIHQDEYVENQRQYTQSVLTWYAEDEVLTDEDEKPMEDADEIVDLNHMSKFGHGTDDFNVLFIRNDRLQTEYEICRMPTSYREEVQGLTNDDESH